MTSLEKAKPRPPCRDVNAEFSKRILSLFVSCYDSTRSDDPFDFPAAKSAPAPSTPTKPKSKSLAARASPFEATIWDIRLRKAADRHRADCEAATAAIATQLPLYAGLAESASPDLAPMFMPERAPRPETPKFLENAIRDQEADAARREKSKSANLAKIGRQFASRVKRQNQRAETRRGQMRNFYRRKQKERQNLLAKLARPEPAQAEPPKRAQK
jgi:hypothetical protein